MKTLNDIPYGHENPLQRPANPCEYRILRRNIEYANNNGDCVINVGEGYYRPVPGDAVDEKEKKLQKMHVQRLTRGECTPEAGMIFSDIVSGLERVADHATNIAFAIVNAEKEAETTTSFNQ